MTPAPSTLDLILLTDMGSAGQSIPVELSPDHPHFIIGQADDADLPLRQAGVQPHHCTLSFSPRGIELMSLGQQVLCNGRPIPTTTLLNDGDRIQIGDLTLLVQMRRQTDMPEADVMDAPDPTPPSLVTPPALSPRGAPPTGQTGSRGLGPMRVATPGSRGLGALRGSADSPPPSSDTFVERVMAELARDYPDRTARKTRRELQSLVERGRERARSYGLENEEQYRKFLHCVILLDNELAKPSNPDVAYVLDTLTVPNKPAQQRIERALNVAKKIAAGRSPSPSPSPILPPVGRSARREADNPLGARSEKRETRSEKEDSRRPERYTKTDRPGEDQPAADHPENETGSISPPVLSPSRTPAPQSPAPFNLPPRRNPQSALRNDRPPIGNRQSAIGNARPQPATGNRPSATPQDAGTTHATPPPSVEELKSKSVATGFPDIEGFRIIEQIASGGMGTVYRAHDLQLDIEVAIKVLRSMHPAAQQQFLMEARAAARLQHPHIVPVLRYERYGQGGYCVMQLIRGKDAHRLVKTFGEHVAHILSAEKLFDIAGIDPQLINPDLKAVARQSKPYYRILAYWIAGVADGLERAHAEGIIHYDVKPSNMMLAADGRMLLGDFGLAALGDQQSMANSACIGTPAYLAPEMLAGWASRTGAAEREPRIDLWGLGLALYELLTYRPAYEGSVAQVLRAIATVDPAPPREVVWDVPPELEQICMKCIARNPDHRYVRAAEMAEALRDWLAGKPEEPKGWRWFGRK